MGWRTEWKAISDRVAGLLEAGSFYFKNIHPTDAHNIAENVLLPHARSIFSSMFQFKEKYESSLPPSTFSCLKGFTAEGPQYLRGRGLKDHKGVNAVLTTLASVKAELSFALFDIQVIASRITQRSFLHLQRTLMVDDQVREKWLRAYRNTQNAEVSCERLGAVHLLSHGIWAFKVDAQGGRTDLVLGEPLRDIGQIESSAETLVLTEWKVVRNEKDLSKKIRQAFCQAANYSSGILAGFELATYRYLVMVSTHQLEMPEDLIEEDITYRHINIAVAPKTPSR